MKLESLNDRIMVSCAHRYCMGRHSYVVGSCQEFLRNTWDQLNDNEKGVVVRDTIEFLMEERSMAEIRKIEYKPDMDTDSWQRFALWAYIRINDETRRWLHNSLCYRQQYSSWDFSKMQPSEHNDDGDNCSASSSEGYWQSPHVDDTTEGSQR